MISKQRTLIAANLNGVTVCTGVLVVVVVVSLFQITLTLLYT